jgi:hypothetical protein
MIFVGENLVFKIASDFRLLTSYKAHLPTKLAVEHHLLNECLTAFLL